MNSIGVLLCIRVREIHSLKQGMMVGKCANNWCSTTRQFREGKLFRLDIDLGSKTGRDERKTEYIWLCDSCAQLMHPEVEVTEDSVMLRLTKNVPLLMADASVAVARVN
jgi:hypothetical protein